jgi:transcriptional regulator with XRE-family HTH domain
MCQKVGILLRVRHTSCHDRCTDSDVPGTVGQLPGTGVLLAGMAAEGAGTVATKTGPTIRRMQLGQELRRLRQRAPREDGDGHGLTLAQAVRGLGFTESKLYRVENGLTSLPKVQDLKELLDRYGVTDIDDVDFLLEVHKNSLHRGWWSPYRAFMPSGFGMSVGLEGDAKILRAYQPDRMFGLFQTEAYARAQFEIAKPIDERTTEFVERNVEIRMRRKDAILRSERPVEVHAILEEAAVRRVYGGSDVMREQYEHLAELAELDHVTVQILPMALPVYRAPDNFILMEFEPPLPRVVSVDVQDTVSLTDKDTDLWRYARRFDAMRAGAPAPRETPGFLDRLAQEMEPR